MLFKLVLWDSEQDGTIFPLCSKQYVQFLRPVLLKHQNGGYGCL